MARNSKRKPTLSQNLVTVATAGMPPPVRSVLGSRLGALLIVILLPILVITGVVSIQWNSGVPKISIDRERAKEVRTQAVDSLEKLREQDKGLLSSRPRLKFLKEGAESERPEGDRAIDNVKEALQTWR
jgi:hypothetical protein